MSAMPYGPRPYLVNDIWWVPDVWLVEHPSLLPTMEHWHNRRNLTRMGYLIKRRYLTEDEEALLRAGAEEQDA